MEDPRRLFFGAEVEAPWPQENPSGRFIPRNTRHITLVFLGEKSFPPLQALLPFLPRPLFQIGHTGIGNQLTFLPAGKSRVVAMSVQWLNDEKPFINYQNVLSKWLKNHHYPIENCSFFPHITLARAPFDKKAWLKDFAPLPFFVKSIHLYQSLGNLCYRSLWESTLLFPFEEFEHTADIAFLIRGTNMQDLHLHAQVALAFKFPPLIDFFTSNFKESLDEIIIALNAIIAIADTEVGCPFKAVSFHGNIQVLQNILIWEMIVDV